MDLTKLTDKELVASGMRAVGKERKYSVSVLFHFLEIERRKLFSDYQCSSLYGFAKKVYRFGHQPACQRILATRLLRDVPGAKEKLLSGELCLTTAANAQAVFQRMDKLKKRVEKDAVVERISGKTTEEADAILAEMDPNVALRRKDGVRAVGHGELEVCMTVPEEMRELMDEVRGLLVHKKGALTNAELFQECLLFVRNALFAKKVNSNAGALISPAVKPKIRSRYIPVAIRREVWKKAGGKCTNCASYFALEADHIHMYSRGGGHEAENLRLLCRNCNQRAALRAQKSPRVRIFPERRQSDCAKPAKPKPTC